MRSVPDSPNKRKKEREKNMLKVESSSNFSRLGLFGSKMAQSCSLGLVSSDVLLVRAMT